MSPTSDDIEQVVNDAMQSALHESEAGRADQASALYHAVLALQPDHAGAHSGLGWLERQAGRLADAISHFAQALQADPGQEGHWLTYLDALMEAHQFATARELLGLGRSHGLHGPAVDAIDQRLAGCAPTSLETDDAAALLAQGNVDAAGRAARSLAARFPQHPFGWKLLGAVLHAQGDMAQAVEAMRTAAVWAPDDAENFSNLGLLLNKSGQPAQAEQVLRQAIALQPDNVHAHNHLAMALLEMNRLQEAQASAGEATALDPAYAEAWNTLAVILDRLGRSADAVEAYRRVLELVPVHTDAHSNMLFCMSQMESVTPAQLFAEHRRFGQGVEARVGPSRPWSNEPDPRKALRVGFVSGDLRNHALARFVEPVFEQLSSRPGLTLHAYYTYPVHDDVSVRLRGYMTQWNHVAALDDKALDALIRADGIDILIDLSGHTAHNRLPVFARKPAPLQASWIGYPGSTGLAAMDYYLTDRHILPPGQFDHLFTEKLLHLPVLAPFQPATDAPDPVPLPALVNGYITFGSFNRLSKISRNVVAAWGSLMRSLPDARLIVAGMPEGDSHVQIQTWLDEEGIAPWRLRFQARTGMRDYLAMHNQVDLCLDTFPYSGGTTSVHALWMGVPTLTVAGETAAGRQTACMLEHNGLPQFIARDADEFVARGVAACSDLPGLAALRAGMRARFPVPSSEDMSLVADGVENALRLMWQRWCAGLAAASFEAPTVLASSADARPVPLAAPIYITRPHLPPLQDFAASLAQIWENKFLTNGGAFHQRFEAALRAYLGVEHISLFVNGTVAMMTALQALGVKGEVITTPYNFVGSAHALLWNSLQPVFADIDPVSFNLDPANIENAITPHTTAILPAHCYGNPCNVEEIERIARKHGLHVIYDASHAFGVGRQGESILRHGDLAVLSFHATQVFNTFEGGAIVCHDAAMKRRIDHLKNFGIEDETTVVDAGINGKMHEVSAALGLLQLEGAADALERRAQVAACYRRLLAGIPGIAPMAELGHQANFSYFPVLVGDDYPLDRDAMYRKLRDNGIHARRYFHPLISAFPMYRELPSAAPAGLPRASDAAARVICLPIYPDLAQRDIERIATLFTTT